VVYPIGFQRVIKIEGKPDLTEFEHAMDTFRTMTGLSAIMSICISSFSRSFMPESSPDNSKAGAFAVQCAISANEAGIPDSELNEAFISLTAVMSAAFVSVADAERDKSKDN
jgi:hypothetical protein